MYRREINDILRTNMKIAQSLIDNDHRAMQLWTILLKSQINQIISKYNDTYEERNQ